MGLSSALLGLHLPVANADFWHSSQGNPPLHAWWLLIQSQHFSVILLGRIRLDNVDERCVGGNGWLVFSDSCGVEECPETVNFSVVIFGGLNLSKQDRDFARY